MMQVEVSAHLAKAFGRDQQPLLGENPYAASDGIVWFFVLLVVALTVLASYTIWAKAAGITPFVG